MNKMRTVHPNKDYIVKIRREIHRFPEVGFDLPKTIALIKRELDDMSIPYTEKYGKSSIVATLAKGHGKKVIALRADIDALPVTEETGLPFASEHEGKMHACGHDMHAAMLLGTAKMLKEVEDELPCEVRLFFQAAEEYPPGGAKLMYEDGVMEGVDVILGAHVDPSYPLGHLTTNYGCMSAASHGFYLDFYGKTCHVKDPHNGVDAIAMAATAYTNIQVMRARELPPKEPVVLGIGEIHGGFTNNVICDHVHMHGTIRTTSNDVDSYIFRRIREISESVAVGMGGRVEISTTKHYPSVINNPEMTKVVLECAREAIGKERVHDDKVFMMGGEDFSFYLLSGKPGVFFHIGTKSDKYPFAPLHNSKLILDEDALTVGPNVFFAFVNKYGNM